MTKESIKNIGLGALILTAFFIYCSFVVSLLDLFSGKVQKLIVNRYSLHVPDFVVLVLIVFALSVLGSLLGGIKQIPQNLGRMTGFFIRLFRR